MIKIFGGKMVSHPFLFVMKAKKHEDHKEVLLQKLEKGLPISKHLQEQVLDTTMQDVGEHLKLPEFAWTMKKKGHQVSTKAYNRIHWWQIGVDMKHLKLGTKKNYDRPTPVDFWYTRKRYIFMSACYFLETNGGDVDIIDTADDKLTQKIKVKEGDVLFVPHFVKIGKLENSTIFHFNTSYIYAGVEFLPANKGIRKSIRKLFNTYK